MKKTLLLSLMLFAFVSIFAQVARELVLIEVGTGTGCPYCPGAAMALEDLYDNGDPVAGIEYHSYNSSDPFNTPEAAARTSYYGISGYPTAQFDGEYDEHVGGSSSQSLYTTYLPKVTARMAIQSEFSVEIFGDNVGNNYDIVVRVTKESAYAGTNLKVRFALTESDIPYSWQGMSEIDFTERLMAPDENGTAVTFAGIGDVQDVNLTFVYNNTWVAANCELIAWIQDDASKVVLYATKVGLPDLEPDVANANFVVSDPTTCEGSSVNFTDLSTGAITSWNWIFEGGTPATSTDENPVVTYATQGTYDVSLEVTDGVTVSTLSMPDYMVVIVPPVQPASPTGPTQACASTSYEYTALPVPDADSYTWKVEPAAAGTITGAGLTGTFVSDDSYVGNYDISVRADNFCGNGTWSAPMTATLNYTPQAYLLSDGGGFCEGSSGLEITQDGSEAGINYLLYLDGVYTGTTIAGTGEPLSYGFQNQEGVYTAFAETPSCALQMWGTPWIYSMTAPAQATQPAGEQVTCNTGENLYTTNILDNADGYNWELSPTEAGVLTPNGAEVNITWSLAFSGEALLKVAGENQCGMGDYSEELAILLSDTPEPVISGPATTCDFTEEVYAVEAIAGNTYLWEIEGGYITDGAGTAQVSVMWTNPGTGTVSLTESTAEGCDGVAVPITVTIDNCTGIAENSQDGLTIYPNPVKEMLNIDVAMPAQTQVILTVYNAFGQQVWMQEQQVSEEVTRLQINASEWNKGYYVIEMNDGNSRMMKRTFVKL